MSSSNKTSNLGLNLWSGSDVPKRVDFVSDNTIIDKVVSEHLDDDDRHITGDEREVWTKFYHKFSYTGNGASSRIIDSGCEFQPTWGLVFANSYMPSVVDVSNNANYNYFGLFGKGGSTSGVTLSNGNKLSVVQSSAPIQNTEYRNYNQNGVVYTVVMFR